MQGLNIACETEEKLSVVQSYEGHPDFDFLRITKILGAEIKVLVTANSVEHFKSVLVNHEISHETFIENVEDEVRKDYLRNEFARIVDARSINKNSSPFNFFPRISEVNLLFSYRCNYHPNEIIYQDFFRNFS